jgi:hypothetical protein
LRSDQRFIDVTFFDGKSVRFDIRYSKGSFRQGVS